MVRTVIIFAVVAVLGIGAFFMLPSRAFGLPDSDNQSEEVTELEEFYEVDEFSGSPDASIDSGAPSSQPSEVAAIEPDRATLASPYDGTINGTYLDIGALCLWNLGWFDDYVFYRSSQYSYVLAYGDISLSGSNFSSSSCTILTINATTTGQSSITVSSSTGSLSLSAGNRLVYSSLGDYPHLDSRKYIYDEVMYIALVALGLHVLSSASRFILRDSR